VLLCCRVVVSILDVGVYYSLLSTCLLLAPPFVLTRWIDERSVIAVIGSQ
jgi:hypothetical protein